MSIAALHWVWSESSASTPAEIAVLASMADWADVYGYCFPSYRAIAARARVSERQAKRVVAKFVALGELAKMTRGHRVSTPGHRPGRTGLQARNHYRFTGVPDERGAPVSGDVVSLPLRAKVVTPATGSGDTGDREVVTQTTSHIRKNRQIDPVVEPSEGEPDVVEAFRLAWNEAAISIGLLVCSTLTTKRRRLIRACLVERSIDAWRAVFARVAASSWCRGKNPRGWVASLDWLIASADPALKVLEGQFDDRAGFGFERPFTTQELADAKRIRANWFSGCQHDPRCGTYEACLGTIIRTWRAGAA